MLFCFLALTQAPDILGAMPTIWPIISPSVRGFFSDRANENNLVSARVLDRQHRRMERDPIFKKRLFETALVIRDQLETQPGWAADWPEDPHECLAIGEILGLWLERDIDELILEISEEVLADHRACGVSREQRQSQTGDKKIHIRSAIRPSCG
jgi:hypothetical protein